MKLGKNLFIVSMLLFTVSCHPRHTTFSNRQIGRSETLVVLPFNDFEKPNSGRVTSNVFSLNLLRYGIPVVERELLNHILDERNIEIQSLDAEEVTLLGQLLQADYILTGSLSDYSSSTLRKSFLIFSYERMQHSVGISARLISVDTGSIVWAGTANIKDSSYVSAVNKASRKLIRSMLTEQILQEKRQRQLPGFRR